MPGPLPNPTKPRTRHGNARASERPTGSNTALVELPASGCDLPVPDLPAGRDWNSIERERWQELWQSPQATMWDDTARGTVAALVVYESAILAGNASAWMAQEARYASEALGLTPKAMLALGWRIAEGEQ